ncbi:cytidylyltransferase [Cercophora newfieldiana]|uniref:Cytidylyltransferase n=1 Tax=Cercophora newfieldiana TaxID=92897 RepID=A0AA39YEU0_9PEZI|nr:cytidylyltransferase [Cercophora newfieldiana]
MRVPTALPPSTSLRPLVDFFARSIAAFQRSDASFQVLCTLPPTTPPSAIHNVSPALHPPAAKPPSLIVLDSSFNPPTRAHLLMATSAFETASRPPESRLLLLLAINNADKAAKPAAFEQRLAMMWAFAADVQQALRALLPQTEPTSVPSGVVIPPVDIALSTKPYFHDKSAAIAESEFYNPEGADGKGKDTEQVILTGYDTLIRIFNPKYYTVPEGGLQPGEKPMQRALGPLMRRAKLRVTMRVDDEWGGGAEQQAYLKDLVIGDGFARVGGRREWGERIELVEGSREVVSSTYARVAAGLRDWGTLDKMVSPAVRGVVEGLQLYAAK